MKMYVGVTDYDWYSILKQENCDEVNFWKLGGKTNFKAINTNDMFLFKLHSPNNFIVGGGFFVRFSILPTFLAWDAFGIENGTHNLQELNDIVNKYKKRNNIYDNSQNIGCIILTEPFFYEEKDWIPVLDAAHIKPFSENGPNISQNGILLRTDIHTLYDKGYIAIDENYSIEVSKRLYEDFGNGKIYYAYHGKELFNTPDNQIDLPGKEYLVWHNENIYLG